MGSNWINQAKGESKAMNRYGYGREGRTIRLIRQAVEESVLPDRFSASEVNEALGITYASTFLPKHRLCNPSGDTMLFMRVNRSPALYSLIVQQDRIQ